MCLPEDGEYVRKWGTSEDEAILISKTADVLPVCGHLTKKWMCQDEILTPSINWGKRNPMSVPDTWLPLCSFWEWAASSSVG